jgi:hypothetical protein
MNQACCGGSDGQATRRTAATFRAAEGLGLAASPTFAIMALLIGLLGDDRPEEYTPTACLCARGC